MTHDRRRSALYLLRQTDHAGVWRVDESTGSRAFATAPELGFNAWRIDLGRVADEPTLFKAMARSLRFPDWFGHNRDALSDCLTDLSWCDASGFVLVIQRLDPLARAAPDACAMLLEVLRDAAGIWRQDGIPFWALVSGAEGELPAGLPTLHLDE